MVRAEKPEGEVAPLKIERSAQGAYGPTEERGIRVIRTEAAWKALWGGQDAPEGLGNVDFEKEMVIWVTMGLRNTGGFSVSIQGVEVTGEPRLRVIVAESSPGPDAMVTMALTTPWAAAVVARQPEMPVERVPAGADGVPETRRQIRTSPGRPQVP